MVDELRADPTPLKALEVRTVADDMCAYKETSATPPIVIGHSFGGFFAQLLAYRNLCVAAVALNPTAPAGLFKLRSNR